MKRTVFHLVCVGVTVALTLGVRPSAAPVDRPSIDSVLGTLAKVRTFKETALTQDGHRLAWVEDLPEGESGASAVYVRDLPSGDAHRVTAAADRGNYREHGVAWSPDGRALAFLSDGGSRGQLQLYVIDPARGGPARRVTSVAGQLSHPLWSPDGKQIAVLLVAGSTQETGALVAYKPDAGVVGDLVEEQRIALVDPAAGSIREMSPPNLYVYDYDWSPDGRAFAAEAVEGSGTNNYWIAQLYVVRADTGAARSIWKPPFQIAVPRWSPDGRSIALIHGIMSDEGSNGGDVFVVPAEGGPARNVTPDLEGSARRLAWRGAGDILFDEYVDGKSALVTVGSAGGTRSTTWSAPQQIASLSIASRADTVAAVVQSFDEAPEVYAGPAGQWTRQTTANSSIKPLWGEVRSLHWTSDRHPVQGWLLYPPRFDPSRRYPMVVSVHGGPSSASYPTWPARWNAVLPTQGYFVLLPNPRGSYGAGEAFTQANVKDFGYGDLRDILAGVDAAIKQAPIDADRIGVTGWSYGGYMTMWAVTQTNRFRAAVAGAGIANWQSYYGQNRIDQWMLPFFGATVYENPDVYARSSPITFIKRVKTPTLVLHGDRDSEVPTPQGYEFWHALKTLGVPTELVIYPDEGHAIAKPADQRDIERRLVDWFDRYLMRTSTSITPHR
jgi:dipeptidyl aminopeptidase/acylaminoacyl peptidase